MCWLAKREGFAAERESGYPDDGTTLWAARRIRVLPSLTRSKAVWTLRTSADMSSCTTRLPLRQVRPHPAAGEFGKPKLRCPEAFITCTRHGVQIEHAFASPQTWAGSDPRAQPGAAILAAGEHITSAVATNTRYLDHHLPRSTTGPATPVQAEMAALIPLAVAPISFPEPDQRLEGVMLDAEEFYAGQLTSGWVPAYL